jgi:hypothetical protein
MDPVSGWQEVRLIYHRFNQFLFLKKKSESHFFTPISLPPPYNQPCIGVHPIMGMLIGGTKPDIHNRNGCRDEHLQEEQIHASDGPPIAATLSPY